MRQGVYSAPKYLNNYQSQAVKKWPEDIQCIIKSSNPEKGSLYLSNVEAAENPLTIKKLSVGAILSCAKGYIISHPKSLVPHYKYIPGQDKQTFDISQHFDQAVEFIEKTLQKTNIIVHCIAGVSRSVSMVIAYLMKCRNLSYNEAFYQVKSKRKIISPNDGFIQHLKRFQQKLKNNKQSSSPRMNRSEIQDKYMTNRKTLLGQFFTPKKSYEYYKNIQTSERRKALQYKDSKNPQSSLKQDILNKKYPVFSVNSHQTSTFSPTSKNYQTINCYKDVSKSMTLIPSDNKAGFQTQNRYGMSFSKQLSPKKAYNYSVEASPKFTRQEAVYNQKKKSGYFDSMNEQLNSKIQAIKKKYEQQRIQMLKNYGSRRHTPEKQSKDNIYIQRSPTTPQRTILQDGNYRKNIINYDSLNSYNKKPDSLNSRFNKLDSIYVPRAQTGYGVGYGPYGRRYY